MEPHHSIVSHPPHAPALAVTADVSTLKAAAWERNLARILFGLLVIFHLWAVAVGWKSGLLPGNEFRQTQTAITTLFVQREQNFSLAYPTPVLGKPWSVPMEFPLYQWTVAVVGSATGLPLIQSARAVSCACFYLSLPAIWLLLSRLRLSPTQRWIALGLMLTCPLYIFYSRAFLIETMALMFSLWFLQSFIAAIVQRSLFWVLAANAAGVGAGLVKVTTFMLYLVPAALWACIWWWRSRSNSGGSGGIARSLWSTTGWIAACVVVPFAATHWWIIFADAIKALNPSGVQLISSSMSGYHFGTWETRLSSDLWFSHWRTLTTNLTTVGGLVVVLGVALFYGGRWRKWILGAALLFAAAPATFPVLYSWHEYYFVANGVFLLIAFGLALSALMEAGVPRWFAWSLIVVVHAIQTWGYFNYLYPEQRLPHQGGSGLTRLVRDLTDPQDVLLIAGNDWSSVIPFYAERRALMIRTHLDKDETYLHRAFPALADESVPILILVGAMRDDPVFLERVSYQFDIDPEPFLVHKDQTVYVARGWRKDYAKRLFNLSYNDVAWANPSESLMSDQPQRVSDLQHTQFFRMMSPQPERYQVPYGVSFSFEPNGSLVFGAHAPSRLWFRCPAEATTVALEFGISHEAFTRGADSTDGVEFVVLRLAVDKSEQVLYSRLLDPHRRPEDRGTQRAELALSLMPGEEVVFETRPGPSGSNAFDWSYWKKIEIR